MVNSLLSNEAQFIRPLPSPYDHPNVGLTESCIVVPTGTVLISFYLLRGTGMAIHTEGVSQNRYSVVGEILEAMKGVLGPDLATLFKLSAEDFVNGQVEPPDALEIARRFQDYGIVAIR